MLNTTEYASSCRSRCYEPQRFIKRSIIDSKLLKLIIQYNNF